MQFGKPKSKKAPKPSAKEVKAMLREAAELPKQTTAGKQAERDAIAKLNAGMIDLAHADAVTCLAEAKKASGK